MGLRAIDTRNIKSFLTSYRDTENSAGIIGHNLEKKMRDVAL